MNDLSLLGDFLVIEMIWSYKHLSPNESILLLEKTNKLGSKSIVAIIDLTIYYDQNFEPFLS